MSYPNKIISLDTWVMMNGHVSKMKSLTTNIIERKLHNYDETKNFEKHSFPCADLQFIFFQYFHRQCLLQRSTGCSRN